MYCNYLSYPVVFTDSCHLIYKHCSEGLRIVLVDLVKKYWQRERGRFPEVDDEVIGALYNEFHDLALKDHLLVHSVIASVIRLCILPEGHEERGLRASATKGHGTEHSRILTEFFEYMYNNVFLVNNADDNDGAFH